MNKGRNILILLGCLLCVSLLSFLTLFQRSNNSGVVDRVRYVLESDEEESGRSYSFYFVKGDSVQATAAEDSESWTVTVTGCPYVYTVEKSSGTVRAWRDGQESGEEAFSLYTEDFFRTMLLGKDRLLFFWQAAIVAVVVFAGGAIILYAEELWHILKRTPESVAIPQWSDMKGIKIAGGCVIGAGVLILILFLFL